MESGRLDSIDRRILEMLQEDARTRITEIASNLPVSGNTVRNRIRKLESDGIIGGYTVDVAYPEAGFPFHYQFICTTPIRERNELAETALDVEGVIGVRELMAGERNIVIEAVGRDQDDITRIAERLDELGVRVVDETLVRRHYRQPLAYTEESDDD